MARKRDYKAEEARRKELARERGFKSRGAQRYAIERGKAAAIRPERIRSERTKRAQIESHLLPIPAPKKSKPAPGRGRITRKESDEFMGRSAEDVAIDWSELFGRTEMGQYNPQNAKDLGVTRAQYRNAYLRAFVIDQNYNKVRRHGGNDALYYWFVTLNHYMSVNEYETRYVNQHGRTDTEWTSAR